jgi:hypothetical protein
MTVERRGLSGFAGLKACSTRIWQDLAGYEDERKKRQHAA